jgi:hypothetical protein
VVLLVLPISGCSEDTTVTDEQYQQTREEYIVITLASPDMYRRTGEGGDVWDATFTVTDINPNTAMVPWMEAYVSVKGADGSVLMISTLPSRDSGLYGTGPEVWYQEVSGSPDRATVGDGLRITSMDRAFEGATFQVTRQGEVLATASLPGTFW